MDFGKKYSTVLKNLKKRYNKLLLTTPDLAEVLGITRAGVSLRYKKKWFHLLPAFLVLKSFKDRDRLAFPLNEVAKFLTGEKLNEDEYSPILSTHGDILRNLQEKYDKHSLNKRELAKELGISISSLSLGISRGDDIPAYRRRQAKNGALFFPLNEVARYLADVKHTKIYT